MGDQKGLETEGLVSGSSAKKSTIELCRSAGITSKDEPMQENGGILEAFTGLRQHMVEHEGVIGTKVEAQSLKTNTMKGKNDGCNGEWGYRETWKKRTPSILDLSVLDETQNPKVESKRVVGDLHVGKRIENRKTGEAAAKGTLSESYRKLNFTDAFETYVDQVGAIAICNCGRSTKVPDDVFPSSIWNATDGCGAGPSSIHIWGRLDPREVLFLAERAQEDREALWSLRPNHEVYKDVLNFLAITLKVECEEATWWMPTTFPQITLNPLNQCTEMLDFITSHFMAYADDLKNIFASNQPFF
ncbi:hypothetical protein PIB30_072986 [Stylosanthes scabra]|uniref:Uncharacterized protein n=1 Tax=Stylosanthes scabra TaxID=79078 RepID=A0ABU6WSM9_9FABA|nr:hypothetical protein [Stylosanthes scabra]